MNNKNLFLIVNLLLWLAGVPSTLRAAAENIPGFIYQGYLTDSGLPASGPYEIITRIYDAETNGNFVTPPSTNLTQVTGGLFTVQVNVPSVNPTSIPNEERFEWWIEHCVRHPTDPICYLMGRQRIASAPHALYARQAATVPDGAVTGAKLAPGAVANIALGDGSVTGAKIADGQMVRSLNGLKDAVTLSAGQGLMLDPTNNGLALHVVRSCEDYDDCYWTLLGNNNVVAGVNFLGTTINVPLEVRVNNHRSALYTDTGPLTSPNITAGYGGNVVSGVGGTISGGGESTGINKVTANWGTVGGGRTNVIEAAASTIGGGDGNNIYSNATNSTVAGGRGNAILPGAHHSSIGGGQINFIETGAYHSTIGGGIANRIDTNAYFSTIAGGQQSTIASTAPWSAIGGGSLNSAQSVYATIGGGDRNKIQILSDRATIGGGRGNLVTNAPYAAIGGGATNTVSDSFGTVPGGVRAVASHYGQMAYASGRFANDGDAQTSVFVARTNTTPAVPQAELFLDGLSRRMTVPEGSTWSFDILVTARSVGAGGAGGISAGYALRGVIENVGGATTLLVVPVAAPLKVILGEDVPAWDANVEADDANDALVIKVLGDTQSTIRWVATIRTAEVSNR